MKRLLYPLIGSILITIIPFLFTFEKGQYIIRGLLGYEYFAILLFFIFIKSKLAVSPLRDILQTSKKAIIRFISFIIILIFLATILFSIAWVDLQNLLAIKNWNTSWYGAIPFITCSITIAMVWQIKPFKFNTICFILFIALILHLELNNLYAEQPLAQFPTIDYLERSSPKLVQRKNLAKEFHKKYTVTNSVFITRNYIDTTRNNVTILVESWGVPLSIKRFDKQLQVFKGLSNTVGIHNRMYSRTRTAEREDLIQTITRDSLTRKRDTIFLPSTLANSGYNTIFLFGSDSLKQWRYKYITNLGFSKAIYGKNYRNSESLNDAQMVQMIDSILTINVSRQFIAWTTTDTKFPMVEFHDIYNSDPNAIDTVYNAKLQRTLTLIAELARKHPETRFIVQGDHNPILSPIDFQNKFYKRWVPFIVLN